jgi:hypothetical protein
LELFWDTCFVESFIAEGNEEEEEKVEEEKFITSV